MPIQAPVLVGSAANKSSESQTTITLSAAVPAGALLLVSAAYDGDGNISSVTDSAGNSHVLKVLRLNDTDQSSSTTALSLYAVIGCSALSAGQTVQINWTSGLEPSAKAVAVHYVTGAHPSTPLLALGHSWGSSSVPAFAFYLPAGGTGYRLGVTSAEGPSTDTYTPGNGLSIIDKVGTSGQGATSNVTLTVGWDQSELTLGTGSWQYQCTISNSRDWTAGGFFVVGASADKTVSAATAWRVTRAFSSETAWSIPKRISRSVEWAILGLGSFDPTPILITSVASDVTPYAPSLPCKSVAYESDGAAYPIVARETLYPTAITTLLRYSGAVGSLQHIPFVGDTTWIVDTSVGANAISQLMVQFPATPGPTVHTYKPGAETTDHIWRVGARKSLDETRPTANYQWGWSINDYEPVPLSGLGSVSGEIAGYIRYPLSVDPTDKVEWLMNCYNELVGSSYKGGVDFGSLVWDCIYWRSPKAGREIFIQSVSKTAFDTAYPVTLFVGAQSADRHAPFVSVTSQTTAGAGSYAPTPVLLESHTDNGESQPGKVQVTAITAERFALVLAAGSETWGPGTYVADPVQVTSSAAADPADQVPPLPITTQTAQRLALAVLIESRAWGADTYDLSAVQIAAQSAERLTPALPVPSHTLSGEIVAGIDLTITSEATEVEILYVLPIKSASAERIDVSAQITASIASPSITPSIAVTASVTAVVGATTIAITASSRDLGIAPGDTRRLTPYALVNGVDVSDRLSGPWQVTREEGRAAVAVIALLPMPGAIDVNDVIRAPVRFGYRIGDAAPVILFTGVVDEPAFDPQTKRLVYTCTDNLPRVIGALTRPAIDALTPGAYWSDAAYTPDADALAYAQDRMETLPASLDLSIDGAPRMHLWEAAPTPHFTFRDDPSTGNFVDQTLRLSQASWREFVNEVEVAVEVRYQRRVQRDVGYRWTYTPTFQQYLVDSSSLPTEDTIRQAAEGAGYTVRRESFTRLPPSGTYGSRVWVHNPDNPPFYVLEANLTLARRWDETITERYTYTVRAPASIARFGQIREEDRITYSPNPPANTEEWLDRDLDETQNRGAIYPQAYFADLDGFVAGPGGMQYFDDVSDAARTAAAMVGLGRAGRRILEAHRQNTAEVTAPLLPEIDVIHTAKIIADGLTCQGKVREIIHSGDTDISAESPSTTIRIALSQADGAASIVPSALVPVAAVIPAPTIANSPLGYSDDVHLGGRHYSPPDDPEWTGWISNYTIPDPGATNRYDERFVIDVGDYDRQPVEVAVSATFDVAIPHDILITTA